MLPLLCRKEIEFHRKIMRSKNFKNIPDFQELLNIYDWVMIDLKWAIHFFSLFYHHHYFWSNDVKCFNVSCYKKHLVGCFHSTFRLHFRLCNGLQCYLDFSSAQAAQTATFRTQEERLFVLFTMRHSDGGFLHDGDRLRLRGENVNLLVLVEYCNRHTTEFV